VQDHSYAARLAAAAAAALSRKLLMPAMQPRNTGAAKKLLLPMSFMLIMGWELAMHP
jgi:hypothetical protein